MSAEQDKWENVYKSVTQHQGDVYFLCPHPVSYDVENESRQKRVNSIQVAWRQMGPFFVLICLRGDEIH